MSVELGHYMAVSGVIFGIGIVVALGKRNAVAVLMGVELMLNAVNLLLLAFARFGAAFADDAAALSGHVFVVFVLTVAAAEAAVVLAMAVLVYRRRETVELDRINLMRW
ncbi:MAG: NADH-quinone oxidoreductase subunit NuoK [Chloroflexi bacterium]|nr:NADH-quinone oxidoreductase subunit NuoK [Chloroflexota bacterium]MDA1002309.1 NADH-quinone oxidoreductase subunit NuoK [Chloroflexota bacterium]MQC27481.1 NADH-quinone oxidoreductase subunit NuoK [Chloroflexota bacterium]